MDPAKMNLILKKMTDARAILIKENPFFGHLAMGLQLACAPCGTACTDGSRLIFDPDFAAKLSGMEMQFVILHEVLHCVLNHCTRGRNLNPCIFNIAADIVVNSTILDMWDKKTVFIAGEEAMHLAPDGREGCRYTAEEIYQMLLQADNNNRNKGPGRKENGAQAGRDHPGASSFDRHDLWQGIADRTRLQQEWDGKIMRAAEACGDSCLGMPRNIQKTVQALTKKAGLDWKQLLHDFIQYDLYDYTFLPPDRRYAHTGFYLPAYNPDEENGSPQDIWICVDASGSISGKELSSAMTEIQDALRQTGLKGSISFFDCGITAPVPFETEQEIKRMTPAGGGGTSFRIIFDYMRAKMSENLPKAVLIITDGYALWPAEEAAMGIPVLWLIHGTSSAKVPWGREVRIDLT
ncbi:MAG: VWA-like domain-containing protein [Eubacteriales bacterium]|nr:VWA-like domain-containing protein [Eubacteriales bacterium]